MKIRKVHSLFIKTFRNGQITQGSLFVCQQVKSNIIEHQVWFDVEINNFVLTSSSILIYYLLFIPPLYISISVHFKQKYRNLHITI